MEWKINSRQVMVRDADNKVMIVKADDGDAQSLANTLKQYAAMHNIHNAHDNRLVLQAQLMGENVTLL